jgi:hypothetical protein
MFEKADSTVRSSSASRKSRGLAGARRRALALFPATFFHRRSDMVDLLLSGRDAQGAAE